jgi:hypothetical protein
MYMAMPERASIDSVRGATYLVGVLDTNRGGAVADVVKTCANCGNTQTTGDFCEKCGTRMPAAAPVAPAAAAPAYTAPRPAAPQPQYASAPPRYDYAQSRGFFGRLFDFSFKEFITPSIIKVLFIIWMIVTVLYVLGIIIFGFTQSAGMGIGCIFGGLIGGFFMLLYGRVMLEVFIVFFRIKDDTEAIAKSKR